MCVVKGLVEFGNGGSVAAGIERDEVAGLAGDGVPETHGGKSILNVGGLSSLCWDVDWGLV